MCRDLINSISFLSEVNVKSRVVEEVNVKSRVVVYEGYGAAF